MLALAVARLHVVLALFLGALVGGLIGGLGLDGTLLAFQDGLTGGARLALNYAMLGAFAVAVASAGLPKLLASWFVTRIDDADAATAKRAETVARWSLILGIVAMSVMSQNVIPVHIAFIPLLIPPLVPIISRLQLDRRLVACCLTFGLVTTYMFLPVGFGAIFLNDILLGSIAQAGLDISGINVMQAMAIPALGMFAGLLVAIFVSYRAPRRYELAPVLAASAGSGAPTSSASGPGSTVEHPDADDAPVSKFNIIVSVVALLACFGVQLAFSWSGMEADGLLLGSLAGLAVFLVTGVVKWSDSEDVFSNGMRMMALIGFIMITAQGFAAVMVATGHIEPLVNATADVFAGNKAIAALAMLVVGLLVTMGIGSSFSTLPIIAAIYVPLCAALGFSPLATVSLIGTAGALGDAGSPASDSTLGPTMGLNVDGQHDHIRDSVIPTFLHFNLPLLAAGWLAAMVL